MRWSTTMIEPRGRRVVPSGTFRKALLCLISPCTLGCHMIHNPWMDPPPAALSMTTPSVDGVRAAEAVPVLVRRPHSEKVICAQEGMVIHGALYFEDPFESQGSENGQTAWTGEDYAYLAYGPVRYLVNGAFFPVSAVVHPPWAAMASDGHLGCRGREARYDARRCSLPRPCE